MFNIVFYVLMRPGGVKRDMGGITANIEDRDDIRLQRIAYHQELLRRTIEVAQQLFVIRFPLVTHDLDVVKVMGQARLFQLSLLVEEIASPAPPVP